MMKKIFSLVLCLMMLTVSFAMAEEEMVTVTYDPELPAALGVEGEFVPLEDVGLQFFCPNAFIPFELSEEDIAAGTVFYFATEDQAYGMTIGYGPIVDATGEVVVITDEDGNIVADYEVLAALYAEMGLEEVMVVEINGLQAVTYELAEAGLMGVVYLMDDGNVLTFNFAPVAEDSDYLPVVGLITSSLMLIEAAE